MVTEEKVMQTDNNGAPAVPDVFPDFAISLDEANRRVKMLAEFVRGHMVEGEDYGIIPGTNTKPTLFKPGAEKLNAIFGLAPVVTISNRVEDWEKGFVSYEVKVTLINKRTNNVEAEGIGSCNSRERRYKNQDAANIANTILKMAKKRSLIDATLSATRASGLFTQDLEDIEIEQPEREPVDHVNAGANVGAVERRPMGSNPPQQDRGSTAPESASVLSASNVLTDAQHRAILAIANRVFGRTPQKEDFDALVGKPIEQLSKSEASALIDRLRALQADPAQGGAQSGQSPRENRTFVRAGQDGSRSATAR
jgi:hypothetical protein